MSDGSHPQVAIKRMKRKFFSWQECMELREIKVPSRMPSIPLCGDGPTGNTHAPPLLPPSLKYPPPLPYTRTKGGASGRHMSHSTNGGVCAREDSGVPPLFYSPVFLSVPSALCISTS